MDGQNIFICFPNMNKNHRGFEMKWWQIIILWMNPFKTPNTKMAFIRHYGQLLYLHYVAK